jgi:pimeloyl-ACP methyl ester carboxylesterase
MWVIAPDLRGDGRTDAPLDTGAYSITFLADDVLRLMDALGIEKAALVGHDWGGLIGWHLAMHAPDRIERYAALSTGYPAAVAQSGFFQYLRLWYVLVFKTPGLAERLLRANDWYLLRQMIKDLSGQLPGQRGASLETGRDAVDGCVERARPGAG